MIYTSQDYLSFSHTQEGVEGRGGPGEASEMLQHLVNSVVIPQGYGGGGGVELVKINKQN